MTPAFGPAASQGGAIANRASTRSKAIAATQTTLHGGLDRNNRAGQCPARAFCRPGKMGCPLDCLGGGAAATRADA